MSAASNVISHDEVAVTDAAVLVVGANTRRNSVTVRNLDAANTVYVGGEGVTADDGFPLLGGTDAGEPHRFDDYSGPVYAICADTETAAVRFIEVG